MTDWPIALEQLSALHFIRPWILLALLILPIAYWVLRREHGQRGAWARLIDPELQPYVLTTSLGARSKRASWLWYLLIAILIMALAGPTWQQLPQPVYSQQRPVVVVLDLSQSMNAQDVIPSRLQVAKIKLQDLLRERRDGQTALVVFAGDAFLVTPLTDDTRTIVSMLPSLTPSIMPVQGSRMASALAMADDLLNQAGSELGDVILITDGLNDESEAIEVAQSLSSKGHRVSAIAVGTAQGGLIKDRRGEFLRDRRGKMVMAPLGLEALRNVTDAGNGSVYDINISDDQLNVMLDRRQDSFATASDAEDFTTDLWREQGPLLVLLCLPFLAFAFRRGVLIGLVAFVILPHPYVEAGIWNDAWLRRDQQGDRAFAKEEYAEAAELYASRERTAAALFRAQEYAESAAALDGIDAPEAHYNRGNALAHAQEIEAAIKAYERTLEQVQDHDDAQFNLDLLKQIQQQQSQEQQESEQENDQDNQQQQDSDQQQEGEGDSQEQQDGEQEAQSDESESDESEEQQESNAQEGQSEEEQEAERQKMQAQLAEQMTEEEQQQAVEQWLRRIPDDPGGLLRRKFKRQYRDRRQSPRRAGDEW